MSVPELDPQIGAVLAAVAAEGAPPVDELPPDEARANYDELCQEQFGPVDEVHAVEDRDADGVPVRIYRPTETDEPSTALVYFHGGGWVVGSSSRTTGSRARSPIAPAASSSRSTTGSRPSIAFPAALDDAWTATRWVPSTPRSSASTRAGSASAATAPAGRSRRSSRAEGRDAAPPFASQLLLYPVTQPRVRHAVLLAVLGRATA